MSATKVMAIVVLGFIHVFSMSDRLHAADGPEVWAQIGWNEDNETWNPIRWYRVKTTTAGTRMDPISYSMVDLSASSLKSITDVQRDETRWTYRLKYAAGKGHASLTVSSTDRYEGSTLVESEDGQTRKVRTKLQLIPTSELPDAHNELIRRIDLELNVCQNQLTFIKQIIDEEEYRQKVDREQMKEISALRLALLTQNKLRYSSSVIQRDRLQKIRLECDQALKSLPK